MSLAGSLKTMHVGNLLQSCGTNLKTGTLRALAAFETALAIDPQNNTRGSSC